jgi:hypothetical protein
MISSFIQPVSVTILICFPCEEKVNPTGSAASCDTRKDLTMISPI